MRLHQRVGVGGGGEPPPVFLPTRTPPRMVHAASAYPELHHPVVHTRVLSWVVTVSGAQQM